MPSLSWPPFCYSWFHFHFYPFLFSPGIPSLPLIELSHCTASWTISFTHLNTCLLWDACFDARSYQPGQLSRLLEFSPLDRFLISRTFQYSFPVSPMLVFNVWIFFFHKHPNRGDTNLPSDSTTHEPKTHCLLPLPLRAAYEHIIANLTESKTVSRTQDFTGYWEQNILHSCRNSICSFYLSYSSV